MFGKVVSLILVSGGMLRCHNLKKAFLSPVPQEGYSIAGHQDSIKPTIDHCCLKCDYL